MNQSISVIASVEQAVKSVSQTLTQEIAADLVFIEQQWDHLLGIPPAALPTQPQNAVAPQATNVTSAVAIPQQNASPSADENVSPLDGNQPYEDDWIATSAGDWNTASNWSNGIPTANADVVFGMLGGPNQNCTMSVPNGVTVHSLTLTNSYGSQTLTLNSSLTAAAGITMSGGSIAQPNGLSSSITCIGPMSWSAGTIGSQINGASTLTLKPDSSGVSSSTIAGGTQKTLGDNLVINQGMTVTVTGDSNNKLVMADNAGINVNSSAQLNIVGPGLGISKQSGSVGDLTNQGLVDIYGGTGVDNMSCIPILNMGSGTLSVGDSNGTATVLDIPGKSQTTGVSVYNNGGTVYLYTGATLTGSSGFTQQSGALDISGTTGQAQLMSGGSALTNSAKVLINGGSVQFATVADNLYTDWDFNMTGGTFTATVDATAENLNFLKSGGGNVTFANGSNVTVNTVNIPPGGMPSRAWPIFEANARHLFGNNSVVTVGANVFQFNGYNGYQIVGNGQADLDLDS